MEGRSYMFSTAKKRSTLLKSEPIKFPRDDDSAPRIKIYKKECFQPYTTFRECMKNNGNNENLCSNSKEELLTCSAAAFRMVNTSKDYSY